HPHPPWPPPRTRRLCIDPLRSGAHEQPEDVIDPMGVDETLARLDDAIAVHEALAILPENCQDILDRFFARDESYRTIGAALHLPAGRTPSRISRCLSKLRVELEGRNPGPQTS